MNGLIHIYRKCHWNYNISFTHEIHLLDRSDQQFAIGLAAANNISDVRQIFDSLDWTEENYREFERIGQTGQQQQVCLSTLQVNM